MGQLPVMTDPNPYEPSSQPVPGSSSPARPSLFFWRIYLALHLVAVLAAGAMTMAGSADYYHHSRMHDFIIPWAEVAAPVAALGFVMALVAPIVILLLLIRAGSFGIRYVAAAVVEAILTFAHFYALLPAVQ